MNGERERKILKPVCGKERASATYHVTHESSIMVSTTIHQSPTMRHGVMVGIVTIVQHYLVLKARVLAERRVDLVLSARHVDAHHLQRKRLVLV